MSHENWIDGDIAAAKTTAAARGRRRKRLRFAADEEAALARKHQWFRCLTGADRGEHDNRDQH